DQARAADREDHDERYPDTGVADPLQPVDSRPRAGHHRREFRMPAVSDQASGQEADPVEALIARMPKAELHLHLDGSLRPQTALELARERGLDDGMGLEQMRDRLVAPRRCESQLELLRAFDLPIALMQDAEALTRITRELVEDVATDGTRYAE